MQWLGSKLFESGSVLIFGYEQQSFEFLDLGFGKLFCNLPVQPGICLLSGFGDQFLQRSCARQNDVLLDKFVGDEVEENTGVLFGQQQFREQRFEDLIAFGFAEIAVAEVVSDAFSMFEPDIFKRPVAFEIDVLNTELRFEICHDHGGDVGWIGQESAKEAQGAELHGHAEFGVRVPAGVDQV